MIHYATFKASRTFLTLDNGVEGGEFRDARNTSNTVFFKIIRNPNNIYIRNGKFGLNHHEKFRTRQQKLYVGAWFQFQQKMSIYPLVGGNTLANLVSESFLGREPTKAQCMRRTLQVMKLKISDYTSGSNSSHLTLFDNGC